jgi:probable rRNA maturation factor
VSNLERQSKKTSAQALSRFATKVQRALGLRGEVNIHITSSHEMQRLNRRYRRENKPTDVLSFPSGGPDAGGDIAISLEIADGNAADMGHSLAAEVKILILHGLLHLAGYDHEIDDGEMLAREAAMRGELKLPVGLIERKHAVAGKPAAARKAKAKLNASFSKVPRGLKSARSNHVEGSSGTPEVVPFQNAAEGKGFQPPVKPAGKRAAAAKPANVRKRGGSRA